MVLVTRIVAPVSACTSGHELVGRRSSTRSATRSSSSARCSGVVRDHDSNASAAAAAAASDCSTDDLGGVADDLLGGGVHDLVGAALAVDPLATDEALVLVHGAGAYWNAFYFPQGRR